VSVIKATPTASRILVVEDEPPLRKLFVRQLSDAGYDVVACADGREALQALQIGVFDALLSDLSMPGLDGLELLRATRQNGFDVPVVLVTGGPTIQSAIQALEEGALQYLVKPVPTPTLLQAMDRAVKLGALARLKRDALESTGFNHLLANSMDLESSFTRALDSVWMACQPIVHAPDRSAYAHEVLLRCTEAEFENPVAFVRFAEHLNRLPDLGVKIRLAVTRLIATGALTGDVFVNLQPRDLADDALLDRCAEFSKYAPRIVFEITERARLDGVAGLAGRIHCLRDMGYRIALDDLGSGYSGLSSLAALAPEVVKLDMTLIRGLDRDLVRQKLAASISQLCRELNILVVAEGVETEGECTAAIDAGCDLLQGYLIGRPALLPAA